MRTGVHASTASRTVCADTASFPCTRQSARWPRVLQTTRTAATATWTSMNVRASRAVTTQPAHSRQSVRINVYVALDIQMVHVATVTETSTSVPACRVQMEPSVKIRPWTGRYLRIHFNVCVKQASQTDCVSTPELWGNTCMLAK
jgi:hypothetical protein